MISKKYFLTDDYSDSDCIKDSKKSSLKYEDIKNCITNKKKKNVNKDPKISFSIKEDKTHNKTVIVSCIFNLNLNQLNKEIKIEIELSKESYLQIANELNN